MARERDSTPSRRARWRPRPGAAGVPAPGGVSGHPGTACAGARPRCGDRRRPGRSWPAAGYGAREVALWPARRQRPSRRVTAAVALPAHRPASTARIRFRPGPAGPPRWSPVVLPSSGTQPVVQHRPGDQRVWQRRGPELRERKPRASRGAMLSRRTLCHASPYSSPSGSGSGSYLSPGLTPLAARL
jgi:hypothetical protein